MDLEQREDIAAERGYRELGEREVRQREWFSLRGDPREIAPTPRSFKRLVVSLQWQAKPAHKKAAIYAARRRWAADHPDAHRRIWRRRNAKVRLTPDLYLAKLAAQRQRRANGKAARLAGTTFVCLRCEVAWCPVGRIPSRRPRWCSGRCRTAWYRGAARWRS